MLLEFPDETEWRALARAYPYKGLEVSEALFPYTAHPTGSIEKFGAVQEIFVWVIHLQNRLAQIRWSHMLLMHYFNKGIPDDEWFISPGTKGQSVEYFPHFTRRHHEIKSSFDYFADVFYYKLFSAWDNLGHLLNIQYNLGIDHPTFHKAVVSLKNVNRPLHDKLNAIQNDAGFKTMKKFRNSVTHNEPIGEVGSPIGRRSKTEVTFGTGAYITSAQIKDNSIKSLDLFVKALRAL
jgi:hypothetical protein